MHWRKKHARNKKPRQKPNQHQSDAGNVHPCHENKDAEWECVKSLGVPASEETCHTFSLKGGVQILSRFGKMLQQHAFPHGLYIQGTCEPALCDLPWGFVYRCEMGSSTELKGSVQRMAWKYLWQEKRRFADINTCSVSGFSTKGVPFWQFSGEWT